MSAYFLVAIGGATGSILRFAAGQCLATNQQHGFPWSTLAVNLIGSFLAGVLVAAGMNQNHEKMWQLAAIGFLGGLTTFSAFSMETVGLVAQSRHGIAAANVLANLAGSLLACAAGWGVGKWLDKVF
jgi:fluoride exporter